MSEGLLLSIIIVISLFGLLVAYLLAKWVLKKGVGSEAMQRISNAIKEGAEAFLRRQFKTIIYLALMFAMILFIGYGFIRSHRDFDPVNTSIGLGFWITLSFVLGALCSLIAGYIGMWVSIRSNIRTATAAMSSVDQAVRIAMRGGAVSGLMVVSMSLLGVAGLYALVKFISAVEATRIPFLIVGYGFGASFVALFAQLGGGIYTKAADVGADLVGKVEAGIPEDDPRNPAVIADLVGDNVGDCAGRGADLFESTAAENIGAMILAAVMAEKVPDANPLWILGVMLFPLVARAFGIIASVVGILMVKVKGDEDPMKGLNRGYYIAVILAMIGFAIASRWLLHHESAPHAWINFFFAGLIGVVTSVAFVYITQYYTEYKYRPTLSIAEASQTGPATNIITGVAVGLECTALPVLVISAAILGAYYLGATSGFKDAGLFGTAVATMGMLATAAYILAMDTFGPITDNAGGIIEMSHQPEEIRKRTDRLDAVGNTTKALTKGYAIGSAALAAFLLFSAYLDEVRNYGLNLKSVDIAKPEVFIGALLGGMLVFLFSAFAIRAVGRAAFYIIKDVRAQFQEKPGILAGTEDPDYGRCVDIVTKGALKEMVLPGLLAVLMPVAVGIIFKLLGIGAETVASLLMVGTITGILLATFFNNSGGAWDNAKKYIESGFLGGKGSDTHKAAVVGDTVGDPFKDTAGPSLHVLIKLLSTITLVLAPLFI
ncbi:MAG: sodium-translocating pyrophosphatase [Candidatus Fischerbacteria bacterium RBG_13_37_8]|uniref:K(+)-insensitive pyrophosphate-energized proton pump n=1 Tax=Candidatus Fischerbacteria bacterium RBG_13_37_8 TaxID=1817863 RepID=A0A1F5VNG1_9BACT|nr:MAG: sodium-translocating pyrophosphatase [Candidatus Fischerbacteria bacterium RBG_13_37_8]